MMVVPHRCIVITAFSSLDIRIGGNGIASEILGILKKVMMKLGLIVIGIL